jgi:hypothetical protein
MLQRYKLRLGDGTILGVDHESLSTWAVDAKAMVQAADSRQWCPLKEFLAAERLAARRAARQKPSDREPVPFAPSQPLPLVYPKPRVDKSARPGATPPPTEAPPFIAESSEIIQALAEPLSAPAEDLVEPTLSRDLALPGEPPKPLGEFEEAQLQAALSVPGDAPSTPPFQAQPEVPAVLAQEPDVVQATLAQDPSDVLAEEPMLAEVLAEDPAGSLLLPEDSSAQAGDFGDQTWIPDDRVPAVPLPDDAEVRPGLAASAAVDAASDTRAPLFVETPSSEPIRAQELAAPPLRAESAAEEDLPLIARRSLEGDAPLRPAAAAKPPVPASVPRPSLQVLADDPTAGRAGAATKTWKPDDGLPVIPLKPLDEAPARAGLGTYEESAGQIYEEPPRRGAFEATLLGWSARGISAFDTLLTSWIEALARRTGPRPPADAVEDRDVSGVPSFPLEPPSRSEELPTARALAEEPSAVFDVPLVPRRSKDDGLPSIPPSPLDDEAPPRAASKPKPPLKAPAWVDEFTGGLARLARSDRPPRPLSLRPPPAPRASGLVSREPLKAPPPIRDMPTLPFAHIPEVAEVGDVYEGGSRHEGAWRWTKRIVVWGILVSSAVIVARSSETWLPRAEEFGRAAFTRLERIKQDRDQAEQQRVAIQEAVEQLPHLSSETIRLLMVNSPTGVLDPPETFRVASDAADRGMAALSAEEAEELKDLRHELLETLRPSERDRIREYDAARLRRLVFPFEGRDVLEVFGRSAYALPKERRERLQQLLGKAIAAGLAVSVPDAEPPAGP